MKMDLDDLKDEIQDSFEDRLDKAGYDEDIAKKYAERWAKKAVEGLKEDLPKDEGIE